MPFNKIIEEQLKKCAYADLSDFDPATNTFRIPRYSKPAFYVGKCYLIKIPRELIGNKESVLAVNWNGGSAPRNEYYKAYVSKTMGKHIYVDCLAYDYAAKRDLSEMWSGWLETSALIQLATIQ